MDMTLCINGNFKIVFLIFSSICCKYTLELPQRGDSRVFLQHMSFQYITTDSQLFSLLQ